MSPIEKYKNYLIFYFRSFSLFWHAAPLSSLLLIVLVPLQALAPALLLTFAQRILDGLQGQQNVLPMLIVWTVAFFIANAALDDGDTVGTAICKGD
ncbi:hypothetical protein FC15_GL000640 [Lapidilactobacillus concavus DSM 17758]|uniref:Uncharacterized protein n=1 Tax=Lapidilactobacillus concavus DSM 17758 TaxID=1423735 RepID=A0A0R1VYZ2_9LACO|nr:hypothetical protein [Lapidilactobacillus concavus]KRM08345.1 hypothetical protein FC15_GL000640 [Lapidilactobacillus concavus DSM 17758]GEL13645.1 hypothetical protein LCO01nite_11940 [Lapidilactobacillus concavus]